MGTVYLASSYVCTMTHKWEFMELNRGGDYLSKSTKWTLWIMGLMLGAIFINFYMNLYSFAYALITVLLFVFMGWGFLAKLKNDVRQHEDHHRREHQSAIDDIDRYTR
jgi:hypothetical protein